MAAATVAGEKVAGLIVAMYLVRAHNKPNQTQKRFNVKITPKWFACEPQRMSFLSFFVRLGTDALRFSRPRSPFGSWGLMFRDDGCLQRVEKLEKRKKP